MIFISQTPKVLSLFTVFHFHCNSIGHFYGPTLWWWPILCQSMVMANPSDI